MAKPKIKSLPKKPKAGAKVDVVKRWSDKCAAITKENEAKLTAWHAEEKKKKSLVDGVKKGHEKVKTLHSKAVA